MTQLITTIRDLIAHHGRGGIGSPLELIADLAAQRELMDIGPVDLPLLFEDAERMLEMSPAEIADEIGDGWTADLLLSVIPRNFCGTRLA